MNAELTPVMESRRFDDLPWMADSDPDLGVRHDREGRLAVRTAHGRKLGRIARYLEMRQSVLVFAPKPLVRFVVAAIQESVNLEMMMVTDNASPSSPDGRRESSGYDRLLLQFREQLRGAARSAEQLAVVPHLDLMMADLDGHSLHHANELVYWLAEYSRATVLAFWDPHFKAPKILDTLFRQQVSLEGFGRDILWKLVSPEEARRLSIGEFSLASQLSLYQHVSGVDVVEVRRMLRELTNSGLSASTSAEDVREALRVIRACTPGGTDESVFDEPAIAGYPSVRKRLMEEIVSPVERRLRTLDERALRRADALVPRGVIFHGPPGTGKTEWGRWLAWRLQFTLLAVHGPDLKRPLVGETEAAIRKLFADARRLAPSLILMEELDSLTPERGTGSNHDNSMVGQFLTEMDGLRRDEAILVVGGTNLLGSLDSAFLRPGRFGLRIGIDYPRLGDRLAILKHYGTTWDLGLTDASLRQLATITSGPLDRKGVKERRQHREAHVRQTYPAGFEEQAGPDFSRKIDRDFGLHEFPQFSGDHLRAVCLSLLSRSVDPSSFDVNDDRSLRLAVRKVRGDALSFGTPGR